MQGIQAGGAGWSSNSSCCCLINDRRNPQWTDKRIIQWESKRGAKRTAPRNLPNIRALIQLALSPSSSLALLLLFICFACTSMTTLLWPVVVIFITIVIVALFSSSLSGQLLLLCASACIAESLYFEKWDSCRETIFSFFKFILYLIKYSNNMANKIFKINKVCRHSWIRNWNIILQYQRIVK